MNIVAHNLVAMNASRQLNIVTNANRKTTEKLSSGYRINRAADNISDGISYVHTTEEQKHKEIDLIADTLKVV